MDDMPDERPRASAPVPTTGAHRPALDADDLARLAADPADHDAKVDVGSDESFPASDPVAVVQPRSDEPPPSSGYKGD